jgi:hypothetical protein
LEQRTLKNVKIINKNIGNVHFGQIFEFVKSNGAMPISFSQPAFPAMGYQAGYYCLARPPPKYVFKNNMDSMNSKI